MAIGPGKYDGLATWAREAAEADGVVLIVLNGNKGAGFSVQAALPAMLVLPDLLEHMARCIRAETHAAGSE